MLLVPFTSDYDQRFITQLGDDKYVLDSRWNERGQTWSFDLTRDSDQEKLLAGAPMQIGQDILSPYALGIGALIVSDLGKKDSDPGPEDLGSRVIVTYLTPTEIAAIKAILGPQGASIVASGAPPVFAGGSSGGTGGGAVSNGGTTIIETTQNITNNTFNVTAVGLGFSQYREFSDDSGDEILIGRFVQIPGLNPNPTVALNASVLAGGDGTVRIYVGGSYEAIGSVGAPSGSLKDSAAVFGAGDNPYELAASFANPGGMVAVKVTMQSSAPLTPISVSFIGGAVG
jgi:hypothetical protein